MKILVDLTYINPNNMSGVAVYALRLLMGLEFQTDSVQVFLLVTDRNKRFIKQAHPSFKLITLQKKENFLLKHLHFTTGYLHKKKVNNIVADYDINIFFTPFLQNASLYTTKIKQIGVLHDVQTYVFFEKDGLKGKVYRYLYRKMLGRMFKVVTISKFSKDSIIKNIPTLESKIKVIYNSVVSSTTSDQSLFNQFKPYILYVNTLEPYKNIETLIKAFAISKDNIPHKLIIKAKETAYWNNEIKSLIKKLDIGERIILVSDNFNDLEMASFYKEAELFISPSLMEGFGYTPIEAAIYKTPVITTNESAIYETTRGLLNYYSPARDQQVLSKAIENILLNPPSEKKLQAISNELLTEYCHKKQAKSFVTFFKEID
jgi:glycosyltransferase involved in cell wall biosynthesis